MSFSNSSVWKCRCVNRIERWPPKSTCLPFNGKMFFKSSNPSITDHIFPFPILATYLCLYWNNDELTACLFSSFSSLFLKCWRSRVPSFPTDHHIQQTATFMHLQLDLFIGCCCCCCPWLRHSYYTSHVHIFQHTAAAHRHHHQHRYTRAAEIFLQIGFFFSSISLWLSLPRRSLFVILQFIRYEQRLLKTEDEEWSFVFSVYVPFHSIHWIGARIVLPCALNGMRQNRSCNIRNAAIRCQNNSKKFDSWE